MSISDMLPDEKTMCHRTGFAKSCRSCVVEHGCKLWVRVTGRHKDNDSPIDMYNCSDAIKPLMEAQGVAQLSQMLEIVAKEVNSLRLEVQGQQLQPMLDNIVRINQRLGEAERSGFAVDRTVNKLIGSN